MHAFPGRLARRADAAEEAAGKAITLRLKLALGLKLPEKNWRLNLYDELTRNELLLQLVELLRGARLSNRPLGGPGNSTEAR